MRTTKHNPIPLLRSLAAGSLAAGALAMASLLPGCGLEGLEGPSARAGAEAALAEVAAVGAPARRLAALRARMAEAGARHAVSEGADGLYLAEVPEMALAARFEDGAEVSHGDARIGMRFSALGRGAGRGEAEAALPASEAEVRGAFEVELDRGPLVERWQSGPAGLELSASLPARPEGEGALTLRIEVRGAEVRGAEVHGEGGASELSLGEGLRVGELFVVDAEGRLVPSRMEAVEGGLLIRVEDEGAAYPLLVDPLISEGAAGESPSWGWGCAAGAPSAMCVESPQTTES